MSLYDSSNIQLYDGLAHVRKRPGMYIGGTGIKSLHYLVDMVLDNVVDMAMAGYGKRIAVILKPNEVVQIIDESGGLRLKLMPDGSKTYAEREMTFPSAGSALDPERPSFWKIGLHSVGTGVTNALSEWFTLDIRQDGREWRQCYECGIPTGPFTALRPLEEGESFGNTFTFLPDFTILDPNEFDFEKLTKRLQECAYVTPKLQFILRDERDLPLRERYFYAENGILDYVDVVRGDAKPHHDIVFVRREYLLPRTYVNKVRIELAVQFTDRHETFVEGFVNSMSCGINRPFFPSFVSAITERLKTKNVPIEVFNGMIAIINIRHPVPQFVSKGDFRIQNEDVAEVIYTLTHQALDQVPFRQMSL